MKNNSGLALRRFPNLRKANPPGRFLAATCPVGGLSPVQACPEGGPLGAPGGCAPKSEHTLIPIGPCQRQAASPAFVRLGQQGLVDVQLPDGKTVG
jgi:hypothetical protein